MVHKNKKHSKHKELAEKGRKLFAYGLSESTQDDNSVLEEEDDDRPMIKQEIADDIDDKLDNIVKDLREERDTIRTNALKSLIKILTSKPQDQVLSNRLKELLELLVDCLKSNIAVYGEETLKTLSLLIIAFCEHDISSFEKLSNFVWSLVHDQSKPMNVQMEAFSTFSIYVFFNVTDETTRWEKVYSIGNFLLESFGKKSMSSTFLLTILNNWAFLLTSFSSPFLQHQLDDISSGFYTQLSSFRDLLELDSLDSETRCIICEIFAFCVEIKYEQIGSTYKYETEPRPLGDGLTILIEEAMKETGRQIGKKARKSQRPKLKLVLDSIQTGISPKEEIRYKDETFPITKWRRYFQANTIRLHLQKSFLSYIIQNERLRKMFSIKSSYEKTVIGNTTFYSLKQNENKQKNRLDSKKARSLNLRQSRDIRSRIVNSFLNDDY